MSNIEVCGKFPRCGFVQGDNLQTGCRGEGGCSIFSDEFLVSLEEDDNLSKEAVAALLTARFCFLDFEHKRGLRAGECDVVNMAIEMMDKTRKYARDARFSRREFPGFYDNGSPTLRPETRGFRAR